METAPKPSPAKSVKRKRVQREIGEDTPLRRSGRVASLPGKPKYRYEDTYAVFEKKISRGNRTTSTRKDLINRVYASDAAREYAINRADALLEKLGSGYPSFVKPMTQSHVTGGFWLGLPLRFCKKYLPKGNEWITLVDETDGETPTYYLHLKTGLSAGWRKFSMDHGLVDGDGLVFELIKRNRFRNSAPPPRKATEAAAGWAVEPRVGPDLKGDGDGNETTNSRWRCSSIGDASAIGIWGIFLSF